MRPAMLQRPISYASRKHKMCMEAGYVEGGGIRVRKLASAQELDAG